MNTPRQIILLAHTSPEIQAFMANLEQQLQQSEPTTQWLLRCLNAPDTHGNAKVFLWSHPPRWRDTRNPQEQHSLATERACRQALLSSGVHFHVLQGSIPQRMETVLSALGMQAATAAAQSRQFALNGGRTPWRCESCSDPACEHRLFTSLLGPPPSL